MNLLSFQRRTSRRRAFLSDWAKDWLTAGLGVLLLCALALLLGAVKDDLRQRGEFHPQWIVPR